MTDERRVDDEIRALIDELDRQQLDPGNRAIVILLRRLFDVLVTHTCAEERFQQEMRDLVLSGYPNGDLEGHRRYHEALIKREERRSRVALAAIEKGFLVGAGVMVLWIGEAIWSHATETLKAIVNRPAEHAPAKAPIPPASGKP